MNVDKKIQEKLKERRWYHRVTAITLVFSLLCAFFIPLDLVMPGFAVTEEEIAEVELICGIEEHTHSDECYTLICEDDSEEHEHTEECYELTCEMEEHQHDDSCYATIEPYDFNNNHLKMATLGNPNILATAGSSGFDGQRSSKSKPATREDNNNNLISATGGSSYFTSPVTEVGPSTKEVEEGEIQNITVSILGQEYSAPDHDGNGVTVLLDEMDADSIDATFSIRYMIQKDGENYPVNVDSPCIYYQLPDGVKVPDQYYGRTRYVSDPNYNGPDGHISGYFSINEDGLIVIQFTEDYIRNKIYLSDFFEGSIEFDGTINRAETQSGDREISIGGLTIQIPFKNQDSQVKKENSKEITDDGMDIHWTITVKNVANPAELSGCVLDDPMFANADVTVNPSDAGSFVNGQFVFSDAANYASNITFTYTESLTAAEINSRMLDDDNPYSNQFLIEENKVRLLADDKTTELTNDVSKATGDKPTIEKTGEESYKNGVWIKSTIYWEIDVVAPTGSSLNGYYITDDALNQSLTQANKLKTNGEMDDNGHVNSVVLMNGETQLTEGTDYFYDTSTGKITFNGDFTSVKVLYVTDCHDVEKDNANKRNVSNTVNLYHPNKEDTPLKTDDAYVSFDNSTFRYGKYATFNYDENKITWEVSGTVLNPTNANIYLNNPEVQFYMKDAAFETIKLNQLTLKSANWNNSVYDFTLDNSHATDNPPYLLIKHGDDVYGKVQYKSGTPDTLEIVDVIPDGETSTPYHLSAITFSYTIDVSGDDAKPENGKSVTKDGMTITANEDGSVVTYENAIGNGLPGDDYKGEVGKYEKKVRSTIGKALKAVTGTESVLGKDVGWYYENWAAHNEPEYKKLSWSINLVEDEGFKKDSVFVDTLKSSDNSVRHIFDESMLNLQIALSTKETGGTTISGADVEYSVSVENNKLTVTFSEDYSAYKYATITYDSMAMVSQIKGVDDDWAEAENRFYNEAEYSDHTATSSYTYKNKNPEYIEKFDLALNKVWSDSDTTKRPDSIQFYLLRKSGSASATDEEKKWKYLTYDAATANWVEHEEEGTLTDDTLYLFSAYRTKNYAYSFANLPKDTTAHDGDYEYKIVEIPVDAYSTSYQAEPASFSGNHSYTITNTRENSVQKFVLDKDGNRVENGKLALDNILLVDLNITHYKVYTKNNTEVYWTNGQNYENYELISLADGHINDSNYHSNGDTVSNLKTYSGQYYIIQYEIDVDILDNGSISNGVNHVITDRIPDGSILICNTDSTYEYQPVIIGNPDYKFKINDNEYHGLWAGDLYQEIRFTGMDSGIKGFRYYIGIPKETMEQNTDGTVSASMLLTNTARIDSSTPVVNTVSVSKSKTDHEDNTLISKDVVNSTVTEDGNTFYLATEQELRYRILVNPEAKKLAATNKSTYDIYDVLKINPKDVGVDIVSVTAKEVNITSLLDTDANGRYIIDSSKYTVTDDEEPITYSYVSGDDSITASDVKNEYIFLKKDDENNEIGSMVHYYRTERNKLIPSDEEIILIIEGKILEGRLSGIDTNTYALAKITYRSSADGNANDNVLTSLEPLPSSEYVKEWDFNRSTGEYRMKVKLSDIPANATDIQVRRNGYQGEDITSVTVESATRYKTNDQGELIITVPDSKALLIEYVYKVDKTSGHITVTNEASIDTGSVSAWDKEDGTEFEVSKATAFSGAQNEVKLVKRDINNYNVKISADFYVAYYDGTKWIFSSENTTATQGSGATAYSVTNFKFDKAAVGNEIPEGAAKVTVDGINHIILSQNNVLYKFIEVPTTDGYLGTNITYPVTYKVGEDTITFNTFDEVVNDYLTNQTARMEDKNYPFRSFFSTYVPVHYFSYGSGTIARPRDVKSELIKNVSVGDNLNIDNTKLLGVKAEKNWNGGSWPNGATALLKLYYSERKITDGTFPDTLKEATADALGIRDSNFKGSVSLNSGMQSYTWTNLPTSINDKRIYYYVREESYTVDGVTYRLQDDGTYTDGIEKGLYAPNYDGNGISRSDSDSATIVTISNTSGLFLKKIWLDYYGGEIDGSSEELPKSIKVELKGKKATTGTEEKLYIVGSTAVNADGVITLSAPSFMMEIDGNITLRNQPNTSSLDTILTERTAAFNAAKEAYEADTSDNAKKQAMDDAEVEMKAAQKAVNDVTVKVSDYSFFTLTEKDSDTATCWDTSVNPVNENAKVSDVYQASSLSSVVNGKGQIAVANQKKKPTPISITANKEWVGGVPSGNPQIQLILYKTTDTTVTEENFETKLGKVDQVGEAITLPYNEKYSYTWTGLDQKDSNSLSSTYRKDYRYFVKEVKTGLTGYQAPTYDNQGRTGGGSITVYNKPVPTAQLEVIKQWTDKDSSKRPDTVYVDLYRIAETHASDDDGDGNGSGDDNEGEVDNDDTQTQSFKGTKENRLLSMSSVRRALAPESPAPMQLPRLNAIGIAPLAGDANGFTLSDDGTYYTYNITNWWSFLDIPELDGATWTKVTAPIGNLGGFYWGNTNKTTYGLDGGEDLATELKNGNGEVNLSNHQLGEANKYLVIASGNGEVRLYFTSSFQITPESNLIFDVDPNNAVKIGSSTAECNATTHIEGLVDEAVSEYVTVTQNADKEFMMTVLKYPPGKISVTITDKSNSENTGLIDNITITPMQITPTNVSRLSNGTETIAIPVTHTAGNSPSITGGDSSIASCVYNDGQLIITPAGNASSPTAVSTTWTVFYGGVDIPVTFTANPAILTAEITDDKTQFSIGEEFHVKTNKPAGFHLQKSVTDASTVDGLVQVGDPAQNTDGYYIYTFKVNGREDIDAAYLVAENADDSNQNVGMAVSFKMVYTKQNVDAIENMTAEQQNNARIINNIPLVQDSDNPDRYICTDAATLAKLASLPTTDDDGNAYHYYIVEDETGLNGYIPWDYSGNNGSTLRANGKVTYTVYNGRNDEDSPSSTTLPTSGGSGTRIYTTIGGILLLLSAAGYVTAKRRRRSDG